MKINYYTFQIALVMSLMLPELIRMGDSYICLVFFYRRCSHSFRGFFKPKILFFCGRFTVKFCFAEEGRFAKDSNFRAWYNRQESVNDKHRNHSLLKIIREIQVFLNML